MENKEEMEKLEEKEYEIDGFAIEPEEQSAAAQQPVAPPQKPSPFADSPYECAFSQENASQQPAEEVAYAEQKAAATENPPKAKRHKKTGKQILAVALVVALLIGACGVTALAISDFYEDSIEEVYKEIARLKQQIKDNSYTGNGNSVSGTPNTSPDGLTPAQVYAKNVDSVVTISCKIVQNNYGQIVQGTSAGSGFIISQDGYIVTNHHVIDDAASVTVNTYSGDQYTAKLIGSDEDNDVALLKVEASDLPVVTLGSSDDLIVGDQVVAIGNALGELTATLTVGYISGKDRTVTTDGTVINMLQTDAAINSGNSGGPLFNMKGEVIGITSAKYSGTSGSGASIEGICFAIPVDDAREIIEELQEKGYVSAAYMNVMVSDSSDGIGAKIESVNQGGAAEKAGIQAGDYILALDEYEVTSVATLTKALREFDPGDTATVSVLRGRRVLSLHITFDEKPTETEQSSAGDPQQNFNDSQNWWSDFFG